MIPESEESNQIEENEGNSNELNHQIEAEDFVAAVKSTFEKLKNTILPTKTRKSAAYQLTKLLDNNKDKGEAINRELREEMLAKVARWVKRGSKTSSLRRGLVPLMISLVSLIQDDTPEIFDRLSDDLLPSFLRLNQTDPELLKELLYLLGNLIKNLSNPLLQDESHLIKEIFDDCIKSEDKDRKFNVALGLSAILGSKNKEILSTFGNQYPFIIDVINRLINDGEYDKIETILIYLNESIESQLVYYSERLHFILRESLLKIVQNNTSPWSVVTMVIDLFTKVIKENESIDVVDEIINLMESLLQKLVFKIGEVDEQWDSPPGLEVRNKIATGLGQPLDSLCDAFSIIKKEDLLIIIRHFLSECISKGDWKYHCAFIYIIVPTKETCDADLAEDLAQFMLTFAHDKNQRTRNCNIVAIRSFGLLGSEYTTIFTERLAPVILQCLDDIDPEICGRCFKTITIWMKSSKHIAIPIDINVLISKVLNILKGGSPTWEYESIVEHLICLLDKYPTETMQYFSEFTEVAIQILKTKTNPEFRGLHWAALNIQNGFLRRVNQKDDKIKQITNDFILNLVESIEDIFKTTPDYLAIYFMALISFTKYISSDITLKVCMPILEFMEILVDDSKHNFSSDEVTSYFTNCCVILKNAQIDKLPAGFEIIAEKSHNLWKRIQFFSNPQRKRDWSFLWFFTQVDMLNLMKIAHTPKKHSEYFRVYNAIYTTLIEYAMTADSLEKELEYMVKLTELSSMFDMQFDSLDTPEKLKVMLLSKIDKYQQLSDEEMPSNIQEKNRNDYSALSLEERIFFETLVLIEYFLILHTNLVKECALRALKSPLFKKILNSPRKYSPQDVTRGIVNSFMDLLPTESVHEAMPELKNYILDPLSKDIKNTRESEVNTIAIFARRVPDLFAEHQEMILKWLCKLAEMIANLPTAFGEGYKKWIASILGHAFTNDPLLIKDTQLLDIWLQYQSLNLKSNFTARDQELLLDFFLRNPYVFFQHEDMNLLAINWMKLVMICLNALEQPDYSKYSSLIEKVRMVLLYMKDDERIYEIAYQVHDYPDIMELIRRMREFEKELSREDDRIK